jgi:hypothetical protein
MFMSYLAGDIVVDDVLRMASSAPALVARTPVKGKIRQP